MQISGQSVSISHKLHFLLNIWKSTSQLELYLLPNVSRSPKCHAVFLQTPSRNVFRFRTAFASGNSYAWSMAFSAMAGQPHVRIACLRLFTKILRPCCSLINNQIQNGTARSILHGTNILPGRATFSKLVLSVPQRSLHDLLSPTGRMTVPVV